MGKNEEDQGEHCWLFHAKRRLILVGRRLTRMAKDKWKSCQSYFSVNDNILSYSWKGISCRSHIREVDHVRYLYRNQRHALCKVHQHLRYSLLKHKRYKNNPGNIQAQCPSLSFTVIIMAPLSLELYSKVNSTLHPVFSICCQKGKVELPLYKPCPEYLQSLLNYNGGQRSREFRKNIRYYNSIFAFTSMGDQIDHSINQGTDPYIFRLNGQNHHRIGPYCLQVENLDMLNSTFMTLQTRWKTG